MTLEVLLNDMCSEPERRPRLPVVPLPTSKWLVTIKERKPKVAAAFWTGFSQYESSVQKSFVSFVLRIRNPKTACSPATCSEKPLYTSKRKSQSASYGNSLRTHG